MSDEKVISMAKMANDGTLQSVPDMLKDAFEEASEGQLQGHKKALVLFLDDSNGEFNVSFMQAGMKMSQCVALSEVAKTQFLNQMSYLVMPEDL